MDVDSDAANSGIIDVDLTGQVSIPACADSPSTSSSWTDFSSLDATQLDSAPKIPPNSQLSPALQTKCHLIPISPTPIPIHLHLLVQSLSAHGLVPDRLGKDING